MPKFLLSLCAFFSLAVALEAEIAEPEDYHGEPYRGEVPATLAGAEVVTSEEAFALWEEGAKFVDVLPYTYKPEKLPEGTVWHDRPHHSIEGAIWLPNVGYQELPESDAEYFTLGLEFVTEADKAAPLVLFCQEECWMSWNAAKRALEMGYENVSWYPDGVDGWAFEDYPLVEIKPWEAPKP